ncbi:hypothetical protein ACIOTI_39095 [Streptomyces sp. NPDC087843]|uniref:hypothetical protein n=1 Tax=Streptomyces sp. NPDC087843 TaxID=3365804 RepID=UPI0038143715
MNLFAEKVEEDMRSMRILAVGAMTAAAFLGTGLSAHAQGTPPTNPTVSSGRAGVEVGHDSRIVTRHFPTAADGAPQTVHCPNYTRVVGGGAYTPNGVLQGTYPTSDGRGWVGVGFSNGTGGLTVYAVCSRVDR